MKTIFGKIKNAIPVTRGGQAMRGDKKRRFAAGLFAALALCLTVPVITTCDNSSDSSTAILMAQIAAAQQQQQQQAQQPAPQPEAPAAPIAQAAKIITFTGSVSGSYGALPASAAAVVNSLAADISQSASPDLSASGYEWFAQATSGGVTVEGTFVAGSANRTFEIPLEVGKTWNITCGIRVAGGGAHVMTDTYPFPATEENTIISRSFIPEPVADGNGSMELKMALDSTLTGSSAVAKATAFCMSDDWPVYEATGSKEWPLDISGGVATLSIPSLKRGIYDVSFNFFATDDVFLYTTVQTVNVLANAKTDTWALGGGEGSISDGKLVINAALVASSSPTVLYVGDTGAPGARAKSDSNAGGAYAPLESVTRAAQIIAAAPTTGAGKDYKLYVCGKIEGNFVIGADMNGKAKSLLIQGISAATEGAPADSLDGKKLGSVLTVSTNVPVTIKNLQITNGRLSAGGGGISMSSGAKVTLGQGALIGKPTDQAIMDYDNCGNSGNKGGGILVDGASLVLESGSSVQGNYGSGSLAVGSGGGGISVINGGSLVIGEGAEVCKNASSGPGGGIYVGNNSSVTVNGGIVNQNEASNYGGGFYLDAEAAAAPARLELKSGQINQNAAIGKQYIGVAKGGGIYASKNGQIQIKGGQINNNSAGKQTTSPSGHTYGAGVYIHASTAQMTNGEISENEGYAVHDSERHCGSAVAVMEDAEFSISGGTISKNKIAKGVKLGAIYVKSEKKTVEGSDVVVKGTLKISGSPSIPYDSGDNAQNYVYLEAEDSRSGISESAKERIYSPIKVGNLTGGSVAASVYAQNWLRGKQVLLADGVSDLTPLKDKLSFTEAGISFAVPAADVTKANLMSPFYVSDTGGSDDASCPGTYDRPYKTFDHAIGEIVNTNAAADYTIRIKGKVSGAQAVVTNAITIANCTGLTIEGTTALDDSGLPTDILDRGLSGGSANATGNALVIDTVVPVTIQNLKITGGKITSAANSGAGISIKKSGAVVRLGDGAQVVGNGGASGSNGGGVYVAGGASLFMYGKSLIGDLTTETAANPSIAGSANYVYGNGGGIYNLGSLYIGYERLVSGNPLPRDMAEGFGVRRNCSNAITGGGGGIYSSGTLYFNSGSVSYNKGPGIAVDGGSLFIKGGEICANNSSYGAGVYLNNGSAEMSGGTIGGSEAKANSATNGGGAVYVQYGKTFKMTGGTISYNKMSSSAGFGGGAVYLMMTSGSGPTQYGTFEMTGGIMENNSAANGQGGAVFCQGYLKLSGKANIPYGVATTSGGITTTETGAGKNDVFICGSRTITTDSFSTDAPETVATITMPDGSWTRGRVVLDGSVDDTIASKFKTIDADFNVKTVSSTQGAIDADIVVAAGGKTGGDAAGARGTYSDPYGSVADAIANGIDASHTAITIKGSVGKQEVSSWPSSGGAAGVDSITLKGKDSSAKIDAGGGSSAGSALTVDASGKTVTIQDLTITGGSGSSMTVDGVAQVNGGGICITAGTVNLDSGAKVYGNKVTSGGNGGGVYVASGTLNIKSGSEIYSNSPSTGYMNGGGVYNAGTVNIYAGSMLYKNTAGSGFGGAIYNKGTISMSGGTIGGSEANANTAESGGAIYNCVSKSVEISGGELSYNSATSSVSDKKVFGGAVMNYGSLKISGAVSINNNTASETNISSGYAYGGAIYNLPAGSIEITGALTMNGNKTSVSSTTSEKSTSQGGAIYNAGTLTMSNGTIGASGKLNTVTGKSVTVLQGGAIYQGGTFEISGSAVVTAGTEKENDVYLPSGKTVTVASVTLSGGDSVAAVTPANWNRGTNIIDWGVSPSAAQKTTIKGQIQLSKDNTGWEREEKASGGKNYVYITSPIYVAGSSNRTVCSAPPESGNTGLKDKPYATIAAALSDSDLASTSYTITIDGKLGAQSIGNGATLPSGGAITVKGYDANAKIDGGGTARALLLSKAGLTTTIKDLTITNGKDTEGAGIKVGNGILRLTDGAIVTGNDGSGGNGGGVYVSTGASLFMYGKALIGDNAKSTATATGDSASTYANKAKNGAGIYNYGGSVYLGYSAAGSASPLTSNDTDGYFGVSRNYATESGGGIYHKYGTLQIASGNVSYNQSATSGGAVYFDYVTGSDTATTLSAGSVKGNKSGQGGALYITSSKSVTVSGAMAINGNTATSRGGAVYNKGTFKITGSSTFNDNTASSTTADVYGGALYNCPSSAIEITGAAEIKNNTAFTTKSGCSAYGGAIMNDQGSLTMSAGTIGASGALNHLPANTGTSRYGGAIYQNGTFTVSDSAFIYPGSENSNDVYLKKDKTITLGTTSLSKYNGSDKMVITPEVWKRGSTFLGGTNVAGNYSKFKCSDSDWIVVQSGSLGVFDTTGSTIYVSESAISGVTGGVAGNDSTGRGTQKYPFATIQRAAIETWKAQAYTISVNGELKATSTATGEGKGNLQNVPSSDDIKATGITLSGTNTAVINANSNGSAFKVNKAVPVTITNIKFTGGSASNGGGIYIAAGTVKLGNGVVVTGNKVSTNGGGVFVSSGTSLFMYGTARIGDTIAATATSDELTTSGTTGCANSAARAGGGIYSEGSVYLGYNGISGGNPSSSSLTGGVLRNYAKDTSIGFGGGIYSDGNLYIGSGNVSYNYSGTGGGGVYCQAGAFKLQGGTINRNQSVSGGGVYNNSNGFMYVSGSPVIGGSSSGAASKTTGNYATANGGGIYSKGPVYYGYTAWTSNMVNTPDPSFAGKINQNYADTWGGGVFLASGGTIRINKGSVAYNYAGNGGGCYVAGGGVFMMYGGTVSSNKAGSSGGALYVETCSAAPVNIGLDAAIPSSTHASKDNEIYLAGSAYICLVNGNLTTTDKIWLTGATDFYKETKYALSQGTEGLIEANYTKFGVLPNGTQEWVVKSNGMMAKVVNVTLSSSNMSTFTPVAGTTYNFKIDSSVTDIGAFIKQLFVKQGGVAPATIGANSVLDLSGNTTIVGFGTGSGILASNRVVQPFKKVILPSSFTESNLSNFMAAYILEGVEEIEMSTSSTTLCSVDGVLYNKDKTKIVQYPGNKPGETFTLPNSVTEIGATAFGWTKNLKTMTLTNKVTTINNYAFQSSSLETITIQGNISTFGNEVFTSSANLTTVNFTGTSCSFTSFYRTFQGCTKLQSVVIPSSVTSITNDAFNGCNSLTSATFKNTNGWKAGGTEVDVSTATKGATVIKNAATNNKAMTRGS